MMNKILLAQATKCMAWPVAYTELFRYSSDNQNGVQKQCAITSLCPRF